MIVTTGGRGARSPLGVLERLDLVLLLGQVLDVDLAPDLGGDQLDLLVAQRLRRRLHLAEVHQDLDELGHLDLERLREIADGHARRDGHRPGRRNDLALFLGLTVGCVLAARARVLPRTRSAGVDDDAAAAAGASGATARAHGSVRAVSHQRPSV